MLPKKGLKWREVFVAADEDNLVSNVHYCLSTIWSNFTSKQEGKIIQQ